MKGKKGMPFVLHLVVVFLVCSFDWSKGTTRGAEEDIVAMARKVLFTTNEMKIVSILVNPGPLATNIFEAFMQPYPRHIF